MKKFILIFALLGMAANVQAAKGVEISGIEPPHWWAGMANKSLQLQVAGPGIRQAEVSIAYPGVTIDSIARLDGSDNWLYLYLNVSNIAQPGDIPIKFTEGKKSKTINYPLLERKEMRGAQGFSSADVLYMIMPDRFANGNPGNDLVPEMRFPIGAERENLNLRHGGDIQGLSQHIGYLDSLGITAVWLNPVLENDMPGGSYHGYATTDYYNVDRRFGSNQDYVELIDTLHNHGIKTVMDMIFNHSGSEHPWHLDPPASDWFNFQGDYHQTNYRLSTIADPYATDYDKALTVDGWFVEVMPDLNQRNPHLMKYLIQNSIWWIEEAQIDGIRMDTYPYADMVEMGRWIEAVLKQYPNFNIVGECWFTDPAGEQSWQRGSKQPPQGIDSKLPVVMDFALMQKMRDMAPMREETDEWNGLNKIYDHLALDYIYADPMSVLRFLDNHDTERFILSEPENLNQWKQAIAMILTVPGIPQLYYGTELLMNGDRKLGDGNVRRDMPGGWAGDTQNAFIPAGRSDKQNEAFDYLSTILKWCRGNEAIANGKMTHFMPTNGIYLFQREAADGRKAIIVMNGTDEPNEVDMTRYTEIIPIGAKFTDILTGRQIEFIPESLTRTFAPREVLILE